MATLETLIRKAGAFRLLSIAFLLGGCFGTETGTENTLAGQARLSDGSPAALAKVMVRTGEARSLVGTPGWRLWSETTADAEGRFKVEMPKHGEMFLEIRQHPSAANPGDTFPEVYFTGFGEVVRPKKGLKYDLQPSGSLQGRLVLGSGNPAEGYWVGIRGSSSVVRLDSVPGMTGFPFRLDGVSAGLQDLTVLYDGPLATGNDPPLSFKDTLKAVVAPQSTTDLGTILYDDNKPN